MDGLGYGEDNACQPKVDRCSNGLFPTDVYNFVERYADSQFGARNIRATPV
jgi:hypothetical protein